MPPIIVKHGVKYGPGAILEAAAKTVLHYFERGSVPESIEVHGLPNLPEVVDRWNLNKRISNQWKWIIFPKDFSSKLIEELTLLQSWTIRPARLISGG